MAIEESGDTVRYKNGAGDTREAMGVIVMNPGDISGGAASQKTPVSGTFTAIGNSADFSPIAGWPINITISGGTAVVQVARKFADDSVYYPVMTDSLRRSLPPSFQLEESETGVSYRIECTAYTSGAVFYRISQ